MKRVFICSPYRGTVGANVARAVALCRTVALAGDAPLAAHLFLPQALDDADPVEREIGIRAGLAWLEVADEVLVAGPLSAGMRRELETASEIGIPIRFHTNAEKEIGSMTNDTRTTNTFIERCLDLLGPTALVGASELGMAYRAWVGHVEIPDLDVVDRIIAASPGAGLRLARMGGSPWLIGAQLSPVGEDMVLEGVHLHLEGVLA